MRDLLDCEDRELMREPLRRWLAAGGGRGRRDVLVYEAWLRAGGEPEPIAEALEVWLAAHGRCEQAQLILKAWLTAGGQRERVQGAIGRWLQEHACAPPARFVYVAWLLSGGDLQTFRGQLVSWLDAYGDDLDAHYVLRAWLERGGDPQAVAGPAMGWLRCHQECEPAGVLCSAWLRAGGEPAAIEAAARRWIAVHGEIFAAGFLYEAWLSRGAERRTLAEPVRRWLARHGGHQGAHCVRRAWRAGGEPVQRLLSGRSQAAGRGEPLAVELQARSLGEDVVVAVVVEDAGSLALGAGGDDEIGGREAVVTYLGELVLGCACAVLDAGSDRYVRKPVEARHQRVVIVGGPRGISGLQEERQAGRGPALIHPCDHLRTALRVQAIAAVQA